MATSYKDAFNKIRGDQDLAHKFVNDPKGTLASLGVSTDGLTTSKAAAGQVGTNGVCLGCVICVG